MSNERIIITGPQILLNNHFVKDQAVVIEAAKISAIIMQNMATHHAPATTYQFSNEHYLVPGFIDLHIHGTHGFDVMDGHPESLIGIADALPADGVTGFLATTMTASAKEIEAVLSLMPTLQARSEGAAILGVHLEGPFIAEKRAGAQNKHALLAPDLALFKHWQTLSANAIKIVTLAPELPEALTFIRALHALDVIVAMGHSMATYEQTIEAIDAGVTYATHLFNAIRGIHQREPGPILPLLFANNVMAELILDEWHLHAAMVDLAYRLKSSSNLLLISDAMRAKCLKEGIYDLGGQQVTVENKKATLADGTLAGSVLSLPDALMRFMKITGASLTEAISLVTKNPARVLKLDGCKGSISMGYDADLVVLDKDLKVVLTIRDGKVQYPTPPSASVSPP